MSYPHPFYTQPETGYPPTSESTPPPSHQLNEFSLAFPNYSGFDFNLDSQPDFYSIANGRAPVELEIQGNGRSSSEEKDLTPGQRRRKEQNRAAQRAFRERKERHAKELELKLLELTKHASETASENEMLRQELNKVRLENRLLQEGNLRTSSPPELTEVARMTFSPMDHQGPPPQAFTSPLFVDHPNTGPLHRISRCPLTGGKLLGAGAAWDLIICHPLFQEGRVDMTDISERLRGIAHCDGQGPVFEESSILEAIQASCGTGKDELWVDLPPGTAF